jgi:hypothetical protein
VAERRPAGPDNPYGWPHQKLRAKWVPKVARGDVMCRRASNGTCIAASPLLDPDEPWQLGHPDETCPAPIAPEHPICNGSTMTAERRRAREATHRRSRDW